MAGEKVVRSGMTAAGAVKDMLLAGLVALGIFGPLVGLKTEQNIDNELIITTRWGMLAVVVAIVMVGRLLLTSVIWPALGYRKQREQRPAAKAEVAKTGPSAFARFFPSASIVFLFLYPAIIVSLFGIQGSLKWVDNFGIQILIYVMLGWGLNIVVGLAGLLDLGYVAFFAVGAYAYALLSTHFGLSFWLLLPMAGILAALWGVMLGFPVLRLRGDYLAIVTLAFGEIIRLVLINFRELTNGPNGINSIPKVTLFGLYSFDIGAPNNFAKAFDLPMSGAYYRIFLYYLILLLALLTAYVTIRLRRLPLGRAWEALREDEIACRSLGINTTNTKLTAFALGATFGGFAGSFFAARQGSVSPDSFVFMQSAVIVAIVVLGGMGSMIGVALAAVAMIGGTELLRELDFLKSVFGDDFNPDQYRMLFFGLAMVLIMIWKPRGFVSSRQPTVFLAERKTISGSLVKEGHG